MEKANESRALLAIRKRQSIIGPIMTREAFENTVKADRISGIRGRLQE